MKRKIIAPKPKQEGIDFSELIELQKKAKTSKIIVFTIGSLVGILTRVGFEEDKYQIQSLNDCFGSGNGWDNIAGKGITLRECFNYFDTSIEWYALDNIQELADFIKETC